MIKATALVTSFILLAFLLFACGPKYITSPGGLLVPLTNCKRMAGRYQQVRVRGDIIRQYESELGVPPEVGLPEEAFNLSNYAADLCHAERLYISSGEYPQYLCREERLKNAALQVDVLNALLESIHQAKDAAMKAPDINFLRNDYNERFIRELDQPCSTVPRTLSKEDLARMKDVTETKNDMGGGAVGRPRPLMSVDRPEITFEGINFLLHINAINRGQAPAGEVTLNLYFIDRDLSQPPIEAGPFSVETGIKASARMRWDVRLSKGTEIEPFYLYLQLKYKNPSELSKSYVDRFYFSWPGVKEDQSVTHMREMNQKEKFKIQEYLNGI
ncbi:MAG: hypothetical protein HY282_01245 [Nitrospirae bacterium]|nr:hypothetical protein [Candidatus Manganitrophaceae bacterium]